MKDIKTFRTNKEAQYRTLSCLVCGNMEEIKDGCNTVCCNQEMLEAADWNEDNIDNSKSECKDDRREEEKDFVSFDKIEDNERKDNKKKGGENDA